MRQAFILSLALFLSLRCACLIMIFYDDDHLKCTQHTLIEACNPDVCIFLLFIHSCEYRTDRTTGSWAAAELQTEIKISLSSQSCLGAGKSGGMERIINTVKTKKQRERFPDP